MSDTDLCPHCHASIDNGMAFCGECGTKLTNHASVSARVEPPATPGVVPVSPSPATGGAPGWLTIGGTVVGLIILVGGIGGYLLVEQPYQPLPPGDEPPTVTSVATPDVDPHILNLGNMPGSEGPADESQTDLRIEEDAGFFQPSDGPVIYKEESTYTREATDATEEGVALEITGADKFTSSVAFGALMDQADATYLWQQGLMIRESAGRRSPVDTAFVLGITLHGQMPYLGQDTDSTDRLNILAHEVRGFLEALCRVRGFQDYDGSYITGEMLFYEVFLAGVRGESNNAAMEVFGVNPATSHQPFILNLVDVVPPAASPSSNTDPCAKCPGMCLLGVCAE